MQTNKRYKKLDDLLMRLEGRLCNLGLWSEIRPSKRALCSQQPFAVDTLSFDQWLQFVFIERLNLLVEERLDLPEKCEVAPMAEEYFRQTKLYPTELISLLKQIDQVISKA